MSNPALNRAFGTEDVAAAAATAVDSAAPPSAVIDDTVMTFGGTVRATAVMLALVFGGAAYGWSLVDDSAEIVWPGWVIWAVLGAFVLALVAIFRPPLARWIGPVYAAVQGVVLGAISHVLDAAFEGIAFQALLATAAVFTVMLVLWATRTIVVTDRLRSTVIGATIGIALFYLVSLIFSLFGTSIPLVWDTGFLGIAFSLLVVGVAAFNLLLDFDLIERGVASRQPAYMDWYGAFGLVITIVWLYLEILRLLAKLRSD